MSDKFFVGLDITGFEDNGKRKPISRVTLLLDDNNAVTAGDDTGTEISSSCPHATQEMADSLLASLKGYQYQAYSADAANIDPAAELGDGVTVSGVYSVLSRMDDDGIGYADLSAPGEAEQEDEYPTGGYITQAFNRKISKTQSYITKTAEEIRLEVKNEVEGLSSSFTVQLDSITSQITGLNGEVSTLTQTASSLKSEISNANGAISRLSQSIDSITLSVNNKSSSSTISLSVDGVTIASETVRFTGGVIFEDDLTDGRTIISGDNIQTGNIDLDMVTLSNGYGSFSAANGSTGVTGTRGARMTGSSDDIYIIVTNSACRMTADGNDFYVSVNTIHADTAIDVGSDERIKKDVEYDVSDRYMDFYRLLRPARYKMTNGTSNRYHTGFIAQDIKAALDESGLTAQDLAALVQADYDPLAVENAGLYSVRYEEIIALNTAMIQNLLLRVQKLESQ